MSELNITEAEMKLWLLFRPQSLRRFSDVLGKQTPMVHYTSAEAGISILSNRKIWLRNAAFMNDASEIKYAMDMLGEYFNDNNVERRAFWEAVDRHTHGRANELKKLYDDWSFDLSTSTFVCCVSEHDAETEDDLGRLSMWRAYGRPHGIGLVVDSAYLSKEAQGLAAYSYAIEYKTKAQANLLFGELEQNVLQSSEYLATQEPDEIYSQLFGAFQTFCLTIKHPGFAEEREWRVIYRPNFEKSDLISPRTAVIGGAPQKVFELPLERDPARGLEIDVKTLVKRVIIGPSTHALAMWRAFVDALEEAGVEDAQKKVWCSGLPLR